MRSTPSVAVLIPCRDEALTIGKVVADFRHALPEATIWVCDNGSRDGTADSARAAGASVLFELRPGKGNAVRALFTVANADMLLLVDGDDTYDAASASRMLAVLVDQRCEMVIARRIPALQDSSDVYRRGHQWGNRMFAWAISGLFGYRVDDVFSGYRAFTNRFVRSFPALSRRFEIETELTVHALELELPVAEIETPYYARPSGSQSKLNTWRDGFRILWMIMRLFRSERPLQFFTGIALVLALVSLILAEPVLSTYLRSGLVPRLPTAVLAMGLMLAAVASFMCGLILDTVTRGRRELKLLSYLGHRAPGSERRVAGDGA